jgi:NAD(P)-dependent dehydrogenase (short-subunit alcohol dehydrogenase family)
MKQQLKILVLGGSGDIGGAVAHALQEKFGSDILAVGSKEYNLLSLDDIYSSLSRYGNKFDILVHCAARNKTASFENFSIEELNDTMMVNCLGFLKIIQSLTSYWKTKKFGRIIIIDSLYGVFARAQRMPYVMSKHALLGIMKTLAIELAEYGVTVNAVSPGYIATKMTTANNSKEKIEEIVAGIPVGRLGAPEDVAHIVCFLADPNSGYITGQNFIVDGGYSCGGFMR